MRLSALTPVLCLSVLFACSSDSASSETIYVYAGDGQTGLAGSSVSQPPSIQITDGSGTAIQNVTVVFAVATGGGSIAGATATTDDEGIATSGTWTLGPAAGANTVTATVPGVIGSPLTFTATGIAIGALVKVSGDNQNGRAGTTLINPIVVKVTDASGNPIGGVTVNFSLTSGAGSLGAGGNTRQVITDGTGTASIGWNLGSTPGTNTVLVFVNGPSVTGNNATFTATGT